MLHKSFKPAKCKTTLKLAVSRIKLLKNKRDVQIKQVKRELAQLLESGQVQTARIRVEHVIREQNTLTAYELIEIYCELIAQRMPIIESQKNCPIDLKEAISSVIFASPRCADIPELVDIRKHLAAKYGKEFVSAAVELRPDCGVNRLLVEKLSAKAPEGRTKIKILNTIAEEHNIKWDPDVFAEKDSKSPEDLLNGPNTFQMSRTVHVDPPTGPSQPIHEDNRSPIIQVLPKHDRTGTEPMQHKGSYSGDRNTSSLERQNWNMPFKDATSAAQAAAFSAEQASIAARAAAELSRQYTSESRRSSGHVSKDEMPHKYDSFEPQGDRVNEDAHIVDKEQDDLHERFLRLKAMTCGIDEDRLVDDVQPMDRFPQRNSSEPTRSDQSGEVSKKIQPGKSEVTSESDIHDGVRFEEITYFDDKRTRRQSDKFSSYSHSSSFSDEHEDFPKKNEHINDFGKDSTGEQSNAYSSRFIGNVFDGNHHGKDPLADDEGSIKEINYNTNNTMIFDDSGSDDDNYNDMESHMGYKSNSYFSPSSEKSSLDVLANSNVWSARKDTDDVLQKPTSESHLSMEQQFPPIFSESSRASTVSLQHESLPVIFDDSDAEEDSDKSKLVSSAGFDDLPNRINVDIRNSEQKPSLSHDIVQSSSEDEMVGSRTEPLLPSVRSDTKAGHSDRSQGFKFEQKPSLSHDIVQSSSEDEMVGSRRELLLSVRSDTKAGHSDRSQGFKFEQKSSLSHDTVQSSSEDKMVGSRRKPLLPSVRSDRSDTKAGHSDRSQGFKFEQKPSLSHDIVQSSSEDEMVGSRREPLLSVRSDTKAGHSDRSQGFKFEQKSSLSHDTVQSSSEDKMVGSRRKPLLPSVRSDRSDTKVGHSERSQGLKSNPVFENKFDYGDLPSGQPHQRSTKSRSGLNVVNNMHSPVLSDTEEDTVLAENTSSLASGKELNLGSLIGGLRNKGYRYPPYSRKSSKSSLSFESATGDSFNKIEQPSSPNVRNSFGPLDSQEVHNQKESVKPDRKMSARTGATHMDSNDYHLKEKPQKQISSYSLEPFEINNRASSRVPVPYFGSDNSDYDKDLPKMASRKIGRPGTEFSRRTKATSSSVMSHPKTTVLAEADPTPQFRKESKSPPTTSGSIQGLPKVPSNIRSSDDSRGQGLRGFVEHGTSKQTPESRRSSFKEIPTSFTSDHAFDSHQRTPTSVGTETSKPTVLTVQTSIKDKASHVHPKLPDYDSLAAHFQSLRQSR